MANTFSQIYLHIIFSVKDRERLIKDYFRTELYKYITQTITNKGQKLIVINGTDDHIHLVISINPDLRCSELVKSIKISSSKWINEKKLLRTKFQWQAGYGVFSYSKSQMNSLIEYINNQEEHHKRKSFRDEYIELLNKFEIEYDEKYVLG